MRPGVVRVEADTDLPLTNSQSGNGAPQPANQDTRSLSRAQGEGRDGGREVGEGGQGKDGPGPAPERGQPAWFPADTLAEENGK